MDREQLLKFAEDYVENTPYNVVGPHFCDAEDYYGMRIYRKPIMAIGSAEDPMFEQLLDPKIVGPHLMLPTEWLPGAKTVVSLFLPTTPTVRAANTREKERVAKEWLFARTDANWVAMSMAEYLCDKLRKEGYQACVPQADPRFILQASTALGLNGWAVPADNLSYFARAQAAIFPAHSSNWSERHVVYVCGLGTFGMSTNLITKAGSSGRFVSLVTDWETQYDVRPYNDYMEYCNRCGACIPRCPAHSYGPEGKDKNLCFAHVRKEGYQYIPRYGCGKCQAGIPCEDKIPD